ncbi:MAG: preprotein translocase subunit SecG [Kiritimatiellia bacterium]
MQDIIRAMLLAVEGLSCLLLIGLILLQKSKGGGLGGAFGGGMGETLFGSRAGNVLTKGTIILGIIFMANTVVLAVMFSGRRETSLMQSLPMSAAPIQAQQQAAPAPQTAPMQSAPVAAPVTMEEPAAPAAVETPVEESTEPAE